jgi:hypothetical protein
MKRYSLYGIGTVVFALSGLVQAESVVLDSGFYMGSCDRSVGAFHCMEAKLLGNLPPVVGLPSNPLEMVKQHFAMSCRQGNPPGQYSATEKCTHTSAVGYCRVMPHSAGGISGAQTDLVVYQPVTVEDAKSRCEAVKGQFSETPFDT